MEKQYFLYKLIAPRPTFHLDMNEEEQATMGRHMNYWSELTNAGKSIVYGPVFDPKGVYGMAVIEVANPEEADEISKSDPAVSTTLCQYELIPMQVGMIRK